MRNQLMKSMKYGIALEMMYIAKDGQISKRKIQVLQVGVHLVRAYCHTRNSSRSFRIDSILALAPIRQKEERVI